jgi:hypothetical protein
VTWLDARDHTESHPEGTVVARPGVSRGCWATTTQHAYSGSHAPRGCSCAARRGKLTCHAHRTREAAARVLEKAGAP